MNKKLILITALFFILIAGLFAQTPNGGKPVVGYIPTYRNFPGIVNQVDLSVLTHLDIAFVNPDWNGNISMPNGTATVVNTAHAQNVKVLASICGGGGDGNTYRNILSSDNLTNTFVANLVQMTLTNNLDGIDVDIEGDVLNGTYVNAAQYESFILKLQVALHAQGKLMTSALAGWFINNVTNAAAQAFDFIGLMSYDAYGGWTEPGQHSPYSMAVSDFNAWVNKGVDPNKLLVGLPFYGYGWGSNQRAWTFNEITTAFPGSENNDQVGSGANVIYYNGIPTIKQKCDFALANAGGVMIWELTQDATGNNSLLKAVGEVMGTNNANLVPNNLAKGKNVTVSSTEAGSNNVSTFITDGDYLTRWSSEYNDNQWFSVDLADQYKINQIKITWEAATASTYVIEVSVDGNTWSNIKSITNNTQLVNDHLQLNATARYIRINCSARATAYGYSVFELEVYGLALPKPYSGTAIVIPGIIQAEDYDLGGGDVAYSDLTVGNSHGAYRTDDVDIEACTDANGGYNVGGTQAGEWTLYTINVTQDDTYEIALRLAATAAGKTVTILIDDVDVSGNVAVPNTGGWQTWETVKTSPIQLTKGIHQLKLQINTELVNVNYLEIAVPMVTAVAEVETILGDIYPNPTQDKVTFIANNESKFIVQNLAGAILLEGQIVKGENTIDLAMFAKGIYILRVEGRGYKILKK